MILVVLVSSGDQNAATWTTVAQVVQGSLWPTILLADAFQAASRVPWRIRIPATILTLSALLIPLAHFMTPIPLVNEIQEAAAPENVDFQHATDLSFWGQGTAVRLSTALWRGCGFLMLKDCPNTKFNDPNIRNNYNKSIVVNGTIPSDQLELFSSGTSGTTIAGPQDIQYRNTFTRRNLYVNNYDPLPSGIFQSMQLAILDASPRLVEGLIIDTANGGICFRFA